MTAADCALVDALVLAEAVAVGDAVEDALAVPLALVPLALVPLGLGDGLAVGLAEPLEVPVYASWRSTCRKESWAVAVISLTKSLDS